MARRIALLLVLAATALAIYLTGLHERLQPQLLRDLLIHSGPWGPLVFVLLFAGLEAFGVPGVLFLLTAVAVWPPWTAFFLNWAGAIGAGLVGFGFARYIGRDWVAARLPERVRSFEARVVERGLQTVIVIRLLFYLFAPAHWMLGLSPVRFGPFLLGSVIGFVPATALWTFAGEGALLWLRDQPREVWLAVAAALLALWFARRLRARRPFNGSSPAGSPPAGTPPGSPP